MKFDDLKAGKGISTVKQLSDDDKSWIIWMFCRLATATPSFLQKILDFTPATAKDMEGIKRVMSCLFGESEIGEEVIREIEINYIKRTVDVPRREVS